MRILFLSQLLPLPLDAGPKIRAYYVLRYLAEAGHKVTLLSFARNGDNDRDIQLLRRMCDSIETVPLIRSRFRDLSHGVLSLFTATPFLILRDRLRPMRRKVRQLIGKRSFDALHIDQLWMAPYGIECPGPNLKVLDQHNAVHLIPSRLAEHQQNPLAKALMRKEASKLQTFERLACQRFDQVVWVSAEDQRAVSSPADSRQIRNSVIPIATDPTVLGPVKRPRPFRVTFLGGMHWPPNAEGVTWFTEKIWPRVAQAVPSSVFTVIGKGAPKRLGRRGPQARIEVAGYVSDLEPYLSETAAFVVPVRSGAGMRVKILEAWCWGLPVVSTSVGAEGIRTAPGRNLLIADDEELFADSVISVLQDRGIARRLSNNGRATVETFYDWRNVYKAWDQVYH